MKISGKFTERHLSALRVEFLRIDRIDPSSPSYKKLIELLDSMSQTQLKQIHRASIPFMSRLAANRIKQVA
jgi:hypothetical protein